MQQKQGSLRQPEPELLEQVAWNLFRPVAVCHIEGGLTREEVCLRRRDPSCALAKLPANVEQEVDQYTHVGSGKV